MSYMQPIEWHEACLKNAMASANRLRDEIQRKQLDLQRSDRDNVFYAFQITEARKQGKTAFDRERFCMKRGSDEHTA